jgi:hypothetical protein
MDPPVSDFYRTIVFIIIRHIYFYRSIVLGNPALSQFLEEIIASGGNKQRLV